jgi:putative SOS response-associated peptidase YedK
MPVLLTPDHYARWLSGSPQDAKALCAAWQGEIRIDRTDQPWVKGAAVQRDLL